MKIAGFLLFIFLPFQALLGQVTLEGRVVSDQGEGLHNINILIYPKGSETIVAFAVSDPQGRWRTVVNSAADSLDIEASSIHYRNERRSIANRSQTVPFELVKEVMQLDVFTVRAREIEQRGDTISFLVSAFAQEHHRSIADVLRTMPGLVVEPSGRILYQGAPINRFYVEGLDLMGGRYTMISNNMPHRAVSTVEVLENHQPIRILEDRVPSYQAALNLRLKREITTTGTAKLGAGHGPVLWDANITPMTFTDRFQVVNSYQANNAGQDAAKQLRALTFEGFRRRVERPRENPEMLGIQSLAPPDFNESRFLDNNIHLLNSNALMRLNNDFQLRTNIHFITDNQRQQGFTNRTLYSPADTLFFAESLENRLNDSFLQGEITLKRNVPDNFLNNILRFNRRWDSSRGALNINHLGLSQSANNPFRNISNELRSVNPVGRHLVEFNSFVSFDHSPQQLLVSPGRFGQALAGGENIERLRQELDLKRFFADHSAGFSFRWKGMSIGPRLGFSYRRQTLATDLFLQQDGNWLEAPSAFGNQLIGRHARAYLDTDVSYRLNNLTLSANLPLSWQRLNLDDQALQQGQRLSRLLFDPRLSADYHISGFWRVRGSWSYATALGDIDGVHYGYILKNHRNLQQSAAPLAETSRHNLSAFVSYRNPITSFFNSLTYFFSISNHSLMYSNQVRPDGATILEAIEMPNRGYSHNLSGQTSKFFSPTRSTLSLRVSYNYHRRQALLNRQLFETSNRFITFAPQVNTRIAEWLRGEYRANLNFIQTQIGPESTSNIRMIRHYLDFHVFPQSGHYLGFTTEFYRHRGNENFFVDLLYRFTIERRRLDIEARWLNIFNTRTYTTYNASAFSVIETTYMLRPSQVQLSVRFSF
jgi:hypothetical protein